MRAVEDENDAAEAAAAADASDLGDASTFLEVLSRLRQALGDARGKIRVSDAQLLAGLDRKSHYASRLIARALRHLGWQRRRFRFDGEHAYGYAKGTRLQRETVLEVASGDDGQLVVKRREQP
jgi:hypothetical protein